VEFYCKLKNSIDICRFLREPKFGSIRPDAFIAYIKDNKQYAAFIEIEISHKGFDIGKYEKFYLSGEYDQYLPKTYFIEFPQIFVVSDLKIPICNHLKLVRYNTKLEKV
jgi:hypothetical protein